MDLATLMTLAGIAYGDPASIPDYLGASPRTREGWRAVWVAAPPDPPVNFAYLAHNPAEGACVLAIRGTYPNPFSSAYWDDGDQDSPFGAMAPWPLVPAPNGPGPNEPGRDGAGPMIGGGTAKGFANLLALTDGAATGLEAAVDRLPPGTTLTVTGHSLGGTLAPVLALHLAQRGTGRAVEAVSFAGMTPGNAAFADLFGPGSVLDGKVRRVFNTLDTVSYGWDEVYRTHTFYDPAPKGGILVSAMLLASAARLALGGYGYTAVGRPVPLPGVLRPVAIPCELIAYVFENLHQHMPDTYLELLGAPLLPFSIVYGSIVLPAGHPAAGPVLQSRPPTVYVG